jgi:hypothetical protein
VGTRRSLADLQLGGDLLVGLARCQEAEDFELTRRQLRVRPVAGVCAERQCQVAGDCGIERELPLWAARIAAETSSASESLSRYPEAPASRAA